MSDVKVEHNSAARRFEIHLDGHLAFLQYEQRDDAITIVHTAVPKELGGRGLGGLLAAAALQWARAQSGQTVAVTCPFVREYMKKHPI
jgi:predicted GNAT family acetyltransferase